MQLESLSTPCLLVDKMRFMNNISRLKSRLSELGVAARPHLKTLKSVEAVKFLLPSFDSPCTVSTLKEAKEFVAAGYRNITYAVGITADKLPTVLELQHQGAHINILIDNAVQAEAILAFCETNHCTLHVLIEIDCDGMRAGIKPSDEQLGKIALKLASRGCFAGVLTHSGGAYLCQSENEIKQFAVQERNAITQAASRIRAMGLPCNTVSVGSTPTAHYGEDWEGVTEVRAGVYVFFDLVMANLGVCELKDIALSVVTRVIGHNVEKNWLIIDAGWMALSKDPGDGKNGYGLVEKANGDIIASAMVNSVNQEHGIIHLPSTELLSSYPIGSILRILPNHACATAAMHESYHVVDQRGAMTNWPRFNGW
ncbi:alanine racemase [Pseudoalteromonas xiamenensis]|uniref:alanine racemase n=1 Tax=Pseudoalteromonas xiamenensis TaxID=882626 RepID=UPI0035F0C730